MSNLRLLFMVCVVLGLGSLVRAEVRGTWLTTTGPDHIASGANTASVFGTLRNTAKLNTVYVESWKNGYTQFPSATMEALIGVDRRPQLGGNRNLLEETTIQAHRHQMAHVAWFEYGFSSEFVGAFGTPVNPLSQWAMSNGYLLEDRFGNYGNSSNGFAWMNPAVPEVRQLLIDITLEAIEQNDLDGVQLDDRLAWPREFGWDATTAALYQAETGRSLPSNVNDSHFRQWRAAKVFAFATEWYTAVKTARPDLIVSVSPSIMTFSFTQYNANWENWADAGLFDEIVPQVYRNSLSSYRSTLPTQVNIMAGADRTADGRLEDLVVGIARDVSSGATATSDLLAMIQDARDAGSAGHVLWYSRGVLEVADELGAFYAQNPELAESPKLTAGRRPAPIVAGLTTPLPDVWTFTVETEGQYRLVVREGSAWWELSSDYYLAGDYELPLGLEIAQVELLADRRPMAADFDGDWVVGQSDIDALAGRFGTVNAAFDLDGSGLIDGDDLVWLVEQVWGTRMGDANRDGAVDLIDLSILAERFGGSGVWADGDFNGSRTVDLADLSVLATSFGFDRVNGLAVPSPGLGGLMLMGLLGYTGGRSARSSAG
ncbi:family 10 glycosylhydrolase [Mucisphaera sp.]|uniref:family 10 glycosylhydrolase n=1 Tax=Mucisphaera sp. TaxID=2913024 RepID=UPI003D0EBC73